MYPASVRSMRSAPRTDRSRLTRTESCSEARAGAASPQRHSVRWSTLTGRPWWSARILNSVRCWRRPECGQVVSLHLELAQQPHPEAHHASILPAGGPAGRGPARPGGRRAGRSALTCLAVEGRFLQADDVAGLRAQARRAVDEGRRGRLRRRGPLGDPLVLPGRAQPRRSPGCSWAPGSACSADGRHPALLARDVTSLDLVCGGRSVLCFAPPFDDRARRGHRPLPGPVAGGPGGRRRPALTRCTMPSTGRAPTAREPARGARSHRRRGTPDASRRRPTCSCTRPTTPRCAGWSARDRRHPRPRAAGLPGAADRRHRPAPAGPQRPAGGRRHRAWWRTTSSSAGRRAGTSGSTSSSCCRASSSPRCCSRSGAAPAASTWPPSGDGGRGGCCRPSSSSSARSPST